jgi:hypothetical protein
MIIKYKWKVLGYYWRDGEVDFEPYLKHNEIFPLQKLDTTTTYCVGLNKKKFKSGCLLSEIRNWIVAEAIRNERIEKLRLI